MPDTSTNITVLADYNMLRVDGMRRFNSVMSREFPDVEFKTYMRRGDEVAAILDVIVVVAQSPISWVSVSRAVVSTIDRTLDVIRKGVDVYREIKGELRDVSSTLRIEDQEGGPVIQCNAADLTDGGSNLDGLVQTLQMHLSDDIKHANFIMMSRDEEGAWHIKHYSGENGLWRDFD